MSEPLQPPPPVHLGNVPLHPVTLSQAVEIIASWVAQAPFRLVGTPNVDHIMTMQRNPEFRDLYRDGTQLLLADGKPVLWAARYLNVPVVEKVSGSDLLPALCERGSREGWHAFFAGGSTTAELENSLQIIAQRYPGLKLSGHSPPHGFEHNATASRALLDAILAARPGIVFMGVGAPKSELWLARHREQLASGVGLGIGAGLRMLAGLEPRAPRWMQHAGLEWSWRLARDPRRLWKRYLVDDMQFFPLVRRWKREGGSR